MLAFPLCLVEAKFTCSLLFCYSLKMSSLAENVGKIISAHLNGPKMKSAPRAVNLILNKYNILLRLN